ncbi:hypothetical protein HYX11_04465 [Candidatus Woesearchaeota archaeon]|nr:hypothetical protein [Candidatus Woesearchaeota archaeon]
MTKLNIPLILPNLPPQFHPLYFPDFSCGENNYFNDNFTEIPINVPPCANHANLSAIYFTMGHYNEDDGHPELVGLDCPFDESPRIYACSSDHLLNLIDELFGKNHYGDISGTLPDVIFDSHYNIQKKLQIKIFNNLSYAINNSYFTNPTYSFGRESLESLWKREKWHFI